MEVDFPQQILSEWQNLAPVTQIPSIRKVNNTSSDIDDCEDATQNNSLQISAASYQPALTFPSEVPVSTVNIDTRNEVAPVSTPTRKRIYYPGDLTPRDFSTPRRAKSNLSLMQRSIVKAKTRLKTYQPKFRNAKKKIQNLESLLNHLKENRLLDQDVINTLKDSFPGPAGEIIERAIKGKQNEKYGEVVRQFALTLNFYSSSAYDYVRSTFLKNVLPHPRTLSKWYGAVDCSPGFTEEARKAIKIKVEEAAAKNKKIMCALMTDDMSIRKEVKYVGTELVGLVDYSTVMQNDSLPPAKEAAVFMLESPTAPLYYISFYKVSQDHIEMFFSAVRSRGGFNNNPSSYQFTNAYKSVLARIELSVRKGANCWPLEYLSILHVSSSARKPDAQPVSAVENDVISSDHSYCRDVIQPVEQSRFVVDIVHYIAGFVSRSVAKSFLCAQCCDALFCDYDETLTLIVRKNDGGLLYPSKDVIHLCQMAEKELRLCKINNNILENKFAAHVINVKRKIRGSIFDALNEHILEQEPIDNHKSMLIDHVIKKYLYVRLHYDAKKLSETLVGQRIRAKHTKLVLFQHQ